MDYQSYDFDKGFSRGAESKLCEIHSLKKRVAELERAVASGLAPRPIEDYEKLEQRLAHCERARSDLAKVVERLIPSPG